VILPARDLLHLHKPSRPSFILLRMSGRVGAP